MNIFDLPAEWRKKWQPASFKGAPFYCEVNARDGGRRIVQHEFPKKERPYAEDMGRRAKTFTVRGYIIAYPRDVTGPDSDLYQNDYTLARDYLKGKLDEEGIGSLILPFNTVFDWVVCSAYRLTEEDRFGGYCAFDMTFMEAGLDPQQIEAKNDTRDALVGAADNVVEQSSNALGSGKPEGEVTIGEPVIGEGI